MLNRLRSSGRGKGASLVVWVLLGLLIIGLTGLGLGGAVGSLSSQNVATVGDQKVAREDYVRTLLRQIDALSQRIGQRLTMNEARQFGIDREVLRQMVTIAALDGKVEDLGLSVGDRLVARRLRETPEFQGPGGGFDRQSYEFYLDRQGLTAGEYEAELRTEMARTLLELAVSAGVEMPPVMAESVLAFDREQRRFGTVTLTPQNVEIPVPTADEAALRALYDAHPERYTRPETRMVTYAALLPEDMAALIDIPEEDLRAAYEARAEAYIRPERRVIDVIAFPDRATAEDAAARIAAGSLSYDQLAEDRGLSREDISLGTVEPRDLGAEARDLVFGADEPGVIGPADTDLGPALYRLNAIIGAQARSFEDVADALRAELAAAQAADRIDGWIDPVRDLLAAGATVEEITEETPLGYGEVGLTDAPGEGLAGDPAFRAEAFAMEPGEPGDLVQTETGGIVALRVDGIEPPQLRPFETVRAAVRRDWTEAEMRAALVERAEALKALLDEGRTLAAVAGQAGLAVASHGPVTRGATPDAPLPADILETVFDLPPAGSAVIADGDRVVLVRLQEIIEADPQGPAQAEALEQLSRTIDASLGRDLYDAYAQMLIDEAGVSVNEDLIDSSLAQYP